MRKMTLLFFVAFVTLEKSSFAQEGADRIKALEEKVQMLTVNSEPPTDAALQSGSVK